MNKPGRREVGDIKLNTLAERGLAITCLGEHEPAAAHSFDQMPIGDDKRRRAFGVTVGEDECGSRAGAAVFEFGIHAHRAKQKAHGDRVDFLDVLCEWLGSGAPPQGWAAACWFRRSTAATAARCAASASASDPIMVRRQKLPKGMTSTSVTCAAFSASLAAE